MLKKIPKKHSLLPLDYKINAASKANKYKIPIKNGMTSILDG
jgi:hypothetical protein